MLNVGEESIFVDNDKCYWRGEGCGRKKRDKLQKKMPMVILENKIKKIAMGEKNV